MNDMISKQTLIDAAERQIIHSDQVEPLYKFLRGEEEPASSTEEPLKFIRSFGDVFITLGVIAVFLAINMMGLEGQEYLFAAAGFVLVAEWLVRVRRLALPGIAILLAILYFVNRAIEFDHQQATILGIGLLSLTSLLFYLRYRMPFSLLPLTAGIVAIVIIQIGVDVLQHPLIFVAMGLAVFAVAMVFDAMDTRRVSHLSDSAFWLHLLAAPLIVHGTMVSLFTSEQPWIGAIGEETLIVIFFLGFFMLALFVDRRALLISTQIYVVYALTQLLREQLSQTQNLLMITLMGLGLFVIFFGSYWYWTRRLLFGFLSGSAVSRMVPDLKLKDSTPR